MHATNRRTPDLIVDAAYTAIGHLQNLRDLAPSGCDPDAVADYLKRARTCLDRIEDEFKRRP